MSSLMCFYARLHCTCPYYECQLLDTSAWPDIDVVLQIPESVAYFDFVVDSYLVTVQHQMYSKCKLCITGLFVT